MNVLLTGKLNTNRLVVQEVFADANGAVLTVAVPSITTAPSTASSTVYGNSLLVKASGGVLYSFHGYNSGPAQFIQLHNAAAVPADGAIPLSIFFVPATANFTFNFGTYGLNFSSGIVLCNSTTGPTKTIGVADSWFTAEYI